METKEKIERLGYLDNKLWIGKITKAEDEERKRLRKELQEAHALDSVSPSVTGRREQSLPGVDERKSGLISPATDGTKEILEGVLSSPSGILGSSVE